jgi:hypothetical protein
MEENKKTRISTKQETPTTSKQRTRFGYRYAYARSLECKSTGDTGQDYLVIFEDETRLSFALCDGVSQSFYGNLAARLLGEALVQWMFNAPAHVNFSELEANLTQFLQLLTEPVTNQVKEFRLPENLAPMVQNALDRKRAIGSESTLIAGRVDLDANKIVLVWTGDSNLRIWGPGGETTAQLGETFLKQERWSSSKGLVGHLHAFIGSLEQVTHFAAYSDGLEKLNHKLKLGVPSNHAIDIQIEEAGEDDISFFEFWVGDLPSLETEIPAKPTGLDAEFKEGLLKASWQRAANASLYEVALRTIPGELIYRQTTLPFIHLKAGRTRRMV